MNRIETLTDGSGNSFSINADKVKILKSHYEKLGSDLDMKSLDHSWKEEVPNSVKLFETMIFTNLDSNGMLDQPKTLVEVNYVVKSI